LAELLGILGLHNRSSQQLKFEVAENQQTVKKISAAMLVLSQ